MSEIENIEAPEKVYEDEHEAPAAPAVTETKEEVPVAQVYNKPKRKPHWGRILATLAGVGVAVSAIVRAFGDKEDKSND